MNVSFLPNDEEIIGRAKVWDDLIKKYEAQAKEVGDDEGMTVDDMVACAEAQDSDFEEELLEEEFDDCIEINLEKNEVVAKEDMEIEEAEIEQEKQLALMPFEKNFTDLPKFFDQKFIDECQNTYKNRFLEVSKLDLPFWNYSRSFEKYSEDHLQTPQLTASSKQYVRATENLQGDFKMPDPRNDLKLSFNGANSNQNATFSFIQPILPPDLHQLTATGQRFNVQVRELHYNISFDGRQNDLSNILTNANNSVLPSNLSIFPGNNSTINFAPTSNSTLLPKPTEVPPITPSSAPPAISAPREKKKKKPRLLFNLPPPSPIKTAESQPEELKSVSPEKRMKLTKVDDSKSSDHQLQQQQGKKKEGKSRKESVREKKQPTKQASNQKETSEQRKEQPSKKSEPSKIEKKMNKKVEAEKEEKKENLNGKQKNDANKKERAFRSPESRVRKEKLSAIDLNSSSERQTLHDRPLRRNLVSKVEEKKSLPEVDKKAEKLSKKSTKGLKKKDNGNNLRNQSTESLPVINEESTPKQDVKIKKAVLNVSHSDTEISKKTQRRVKKTSRKVVHYSSSSSDDELDFVKDKKKSSGIKKKSPEVRKKSSETKKLTVNVKKLTLSDMSCGSSCSTVTSDDDSKLFMAAYFNQLREKKRLLHRQDKFERRLKEFNAQKGEKTVARKKRAPPQKVKQEAVKELPKKPTVGLSTDTEDDDDFFVKAVARARQNKMTG